MSLCAKNIWGIWQAFSAPFCIYLIGYRTTVAGRYLDICTKFSHHPWVRQMYPEVDIWPTLKGHCWMLNDDVWGTWSNNNSCASSITVLSSRFLRLNAKLSVNSMTYCLFTQYEQAKHELPGPAILMRVWDMKSSLLSACRCFVKNA